MISVLKVLENTAGNLQTAGKFAQNNFHERVLPEKREQSFSEHTLYF